MNYLNNKSVYKNNDCSAHEIVYLPNINIVICVGLAAKRTTNHIINAKRFISRAITIILYSLWHSSNVYRFYGECLLNNGYNVNIGLMHIII